MKKVMIVDDAAFMRISLKTILERNGFEVVGEAENGAEAIKKYVELKPDIVTMDITMPEMDGVQALKAIRANDLNAKILMISSIGQQHLVKEAILNGAKGFILKPWKEEHVIEAMKKL